MARHFTEFDNLQFQSIFDYLASGRAYSYLKDDIARFDAVPFALGFDEADNWLLPNIDIESGYAAAGLSSQAAKEDTVQAPPLDIGFSSPFGATLNLSTLSSPIGIVINGIDIGDGSGISVSSAGDINGDGFDDIIIGAVGADPNGGMYDNSGESYVIFGQAARIGDSFELSSLLAVNGGDGTAGFVINGIESGDLSGWSVSSAGDINGDGFDDIIIGARLGDPNGNASGESYVIFGQAGGFGPSLDLSSLLAVNGGDGSVGFVINGIDATDQSGYSVSSAGDINGDGFDDIIIGAFRADPNGNGSGESYVIFGQAAGFGASLELSSLLAVNGGDGSVGFVINGIDEFDQSGYSVSSAGDINGDGFDDIIIGAPQADPNGSNSGESYVVFGSDVGFGSTLELSSLDGTNGFIINGTFDLDRSGTSVSSAGDINGDGIDDIIIGAPNATGLTLAPGESYIVFGQSGGFAANIDLTNLDGTNGFALQGIFVGNSGADYSGNSVSAAGDVNGDGFDDILIGASRAGGNLSETAEAGESYVVFGRASGFGAVFELSSLLTANGANGSSGFVINGIDADDQSGTSVSAAGDVDGDGFDDIIIGAPGGDPNGNGSGESYVIYGRASGPFELSALIDVNGGDGSVGFIINGRAQSHYSGFSVSSAGDINGDGFDDILIGAPQADPNGSNSGESYVIFGQAGGFGSSLDLSSLLAVNGGDGSVGFVINGIDADDQSGRAVSSAGDINGDGFDDIIIGAFRADPNGSRSGESYVIFGQAGGFGASLELSSLLAANGGDGSAGFVINGIDVNDYSGWSVSSAGDINGDGFDDILIGAPRNSGVGATGAGESYVIFGQAGGFGASLELSSLDGGNGFILNGIDENDRSGVSVSAAGDINNDGYDDILIGASGGDPIGSASGESYIIYGRADFGLTVEILSITDDIFTANDNGENVRGLAGDDIINGGGGGDILEGGAGDDILDGGDANDHLDGGDDNDILEGGARDDHLDGGAGLDTAQYLGARIDYIVSDNMDGTYSVWNFVGSEGTDTLENIETLVFSDLTVDIVTALSGNAIVGTPDNDNLMGTVDGDVIFGFAGNDTLTGLAGDDEINGEDGADTLIGGEGADVLNGGAGFDSVDYRGATSRVAFDVVIGGTIGEANGDTFSEIERYYLSDFNDTVTGSDANEFFFGEDGDDTINAGGGIDRVYGGEGNDIQRGQAGNDQLYGSAGADQLNGGTGFDIANYTLASAAVIVNMLTGGTGGEAAGDSYFGIEAVYGTDFDDSITGNNSVNELRGFDGDDTLFGLGGNDRFFGGDGADSFDGGTGTDIVNYTVATAGVTLDLVSGGTAGEATGDSYISIEWVFGSAFDDDISGDDLNNRLEGRDGNDTLNGAGGNDRLLGGDGNDTIHGGDGVDTIFGQDGNDVMTGGGGNDFFFGDSGADSHDGGEGTDTVSYLASSSGVTVNMSGIGSASTGDAAGDSFTSIERIFGSGHDDNLIGNFEDNVLIGNGGNDYLIGGGGNDTLIGGAGVDSFGYVVGVDGAVVISGFTLNETIYFESGIWENFGLLQDIASDAGANVIFDFGGGDTLTIVGHNLADLDASNFIFNGTPPAAAPLGDPDAFAADMVDIFNMDALI